MPKGFFEKQDNEASSAIDRRSNYLDDVSVSVSGQHREPNKDRCEIVFENKRRFIFKCVNPITDFIYFTITSEFGCNL